MHIDKFLDSVREDHLSSSVFRLALCLSKTEINNRDLVNLNQNKAKVKDLMSLNQNKAKVKDLVSLNKKQAARDAKIETQLPSRGWYTCSISVVTWINLEMIIGYNNVTI
jgi:hypothetical protein